MDTFRGGGCLATAVLQLRTVGFDLFARLMIIVLRQIETGLYLSTVGGTSERKDARVFGTTKEAVDLAWILPGPLELYCDLGEE